MNRLYRFSTEGCLRIAAQDIIYSTGLGLETAAPGDI
jgi:hypothetical protein